MNQLVDGTYSQGDKEMYRDLYNSLLTVQGGSKADTYFILKDFRSYADTQKKVEEAYKDAANAKPGSITAKANLVKAFDERNKKK